jgi:hypothetical protein
MMIGLLLMATPDLEVGAGQSEEQSGSQTALSGTVTSLDASENSAATVVHGAYLPPINNYGEEVLAFNDLVGKDIGILNYFVGWYFAPYQYRWLPERLAAQMPEGRRPVIMLSWEPIGRDCTVHGPDQSGDWSAETSLYDIVNGQCDVYLRRVAEELKNLPFSFMIRFAPEMNLDGKTWWVGHYQSDPELYISAYRRVHDVMQSVGFQNAQWVWSPSYASDPRTDWNSLFNYYPGDQYVDWVGIVAFNQAEWLDVPWWSLTDLLDSATWDHVLPEVMCQYAKPIILEMGSVDGSRPEDGTKANWVRDAYQEIHQFPFIRAVFWFNDFDFSDPARADFRTVGGSSGDPDPWHHGYAYPLPTSDGRWTQAYREAVASDTLISHVPPLEELTPPSTYCDGRPTVSAPTAILVAPGETRSLTISAVGIDQNSALSLAGLPPKVTAEFSQPSLRAPWDEVDVWLQIGPNAGVGSHSLLWQVDTGTTVYEQSTALKIVRKVHRHYLPLFSGE